MQISEFLGDVWEDQHQCDYLNTLFNFIDAIDFVGDRDFPTLVSRWLENIPRPEYHLAWMASSYENKEEIFKSEHMPYIAEMEPLFDCIEGLENKEILKLIKDYRKSPRKAVVPTDVDTTYANSIVYVLPLVRDTKNEVLSITLDHKQIYAD